MAQSNVNLFCFAYAGASAVAYARWKRRLPGWIQVRPVELPGHGARLGEPLSTSVQGMVEGVYRGLLAELDRPFALFGHSLGSVVAFELARRLSREGQPAPIVLFASGGDAPARRNAERYAKLRSDQDFLQELVRLDGTPEVALKDPELMALTLPILRADFGACASYRCEPGQQLHCPIQVFGGTRDTTTPETLAAWAEHTSAPCWLDLLPGGHFFIHEREAELLELMVARLAELLGRPAAVEPPGAPAPGLGPC